MAMAAKEMRMQHGRLLKASELLLQPSMPHHVHTLSPPPPVQHPTPTPTPTPHLPPRHPPGLEQEIERKYGLADKAKVREEAIFDMYKKHLKSLKEVVTEDMDKVRTGGAARARAWGPKHVRGAILCIRGGDVGQEHVACSS